MWQRISALLVAIALAVGCNDPAPPSTAPELAQRSNGFGGPGALVGVGGGGGGGGVWVSTFLSPLSLTTGANTVYNDVNLGALGAVNYVNVNCTDSTGSVVTGFVSGGVPAGTILIYHNIHGSQGHRVGNHELSAAGNQIEPFGFADFTIRPDTVAQFMYDGTYWIQIGITTSG